VIVVFWRGGLGCMDLQTCASSCSSSSKWLCMLIVCSRGSHPMSTCGRVCRVRINIYLYVYIHECIYIRTRQIRPSSKRHEQGHAHKLVLVVCGWVLTNNMPLSRLQLFGLKSNLRCVCFHENRIYPVQIYIYMYTHIYTYIYRYI